uniref:Uncharacterized protein n=1 Tax=Anguilla anguilla TaxID=7936 RepID=A0A0E9RTW2_ANGAN
MSKPVGCRALGKRGQICFPCGVNGSRYQGNSTATNLYMFRISLYIMNQLRRTSCYFQRCTAKKTI